MESEQFPFVPRYKRIFSTFKLDIGSRVFLEDVDGEVFQKGIEKSRKKIKAFLENESYVMDTILPSAEDNGFVGFCDFYIML